MKPQVMLVLSILSVNVFAHSGRTNKNGCHAGNKPYHCHIGRNNGQTNANSGQSNSTKTQAWDLNLGYQFQIDKFSCFPYIGASIGQSDKNNSASLGLDVGLRLKNGIYIGGTNTSKSFKFGYKFFHLSAGNRKRIGIGFTYPFYLQNSAFYASGSVLFSDKAEYE